MNLGLEQRHFAPCHPSKFARAATCGKHFVLAIKNIVWQVKLEIELTCVPRSAGVKDEVTMARLIRHA